MDNVQLDWVVGTQNYTTVSIWGRTQYCHVLMDLNMETATKLEGVLDLLSLSKAFIHLIPINKQC